MDVLNKFDGSKIAEIEEIPFESLELNVTSNEFVNIPKFGHLVIQCLNEILTDSDGIALMSRETGKTVSSCKNEITETIRQCEYDFVPEIIKRIPSGLIRLKSMNISDVIVLESSLPIYSMVHGLFSSLQKLHRVTMIHSPIAPVTSMTLSSTIFEKYAETGTLILDVLDKNFLDNLDKTFTNNNISAWGLHEDIRHIQSGVQRNQVTWKPLGNMISIIEDRQRLEMASNSLSSLSYNTVSNRGLRNQLFLVSDKNYTFFKNRVVEFLKRDIKEGYGPNGDINYFCNPSDIEKSRDSVKELLAHDFDYTDGLYEGVHLLDNQYGKEFPEMKHIAGPVIVIMHYSNMQDALEKCARFTERMFVNVFSDNLSKMEFVEQADGGNSVILRNVEESKNLLSFL